MRELWHTGDPFTVGLLAHLVLACGRPLAQTPWLDQLMPEGRPPVLTPSQERQAATILGIPMAAAVPAAPPAAVPPAAPALDFDDAPRRRRPLAEKGSGLIWVTVLGGLLLIGVLVGVGVVILGSKNKPADVTQTDPPPAPKDDKPAAAPVVPPPPPQSPPTPPVGQPLTGTNPNPTPPAPPPDPPAAAETVRVAWAVPLDEGGGRGVYAARFSADGSRVIAFPNASDVPITTFDAATGRRRAAFREHGRARPLAAPLPRGRVLSAGTEPVLLVWDDATGRAVARVPVTDDPANRYALVTDRTGRYAATSTPQGVQVFDIDQGREVLSLPRAEAAPMYHITLAFAPDGTGVLTADGTTLTARTLPGGAAGPPIPVDIGGPIQAILGWSPGRGLAALFTSRGPGRDGRVVVVRLDTGRAVHTVPVEGDPHARLTPDGRHLVAAERDAVRVWDTATWAIVGQATVPQAHFADLDISPDGRLAVVTAHDGRLRLLTLGAGVGGGPGTPDPGINAGGEAGVQTGVERRLRRGPRPHAPGGPVLRRRHPPRRPGLPGGRDAHVRSRDRQAARHPRRDRGVAGHRVPRRRREGDHLRRQRPGRQDLVPRNRAGTRHHPRPARRPVSDSSTLSPDRPGRLCCGGTGSTTEIAVLDTPDQQEQVLGESRPPRAWGRRDPVAPTGTAVLAPPRGTGRCCSPPPTAAARPNSTCRSPDAGTPPLPRPADSRPHPGPLPGRPRAAVARLRRVARRVRPAHPGAVRPGRGDRAGSPGTAGRLGASRRPDPTGGWAFEVYNTATWPSVARGGPSRSPPTACSTSPRTAGGRWSGRPTAGCRPTTCRTIARPRASRPWPAAPPATPSRTRTPSPRRTPW